MSTATKQKKIQSNYDHLMELPLVKKLQKKLRTLKDENRALQRVILHFGNSLNEESEVIDLTNEKDDINLEIVGKSLNKHHVDDEEHIQYDIVDSLDSNIVVKKHKSYVGSFNKLYTNENSMIVKLLCVKLCMF